MTVYHDAVAALPISGSAIKTLVRNVFVARMPYVLIDSEDSRNLAAIDPSTGAKIIDIMFLGRVFHYDPTDTTTAHDGTSCLVSADGLRYKLAVGTDVFAYAVLDNTIATPPVSPSIGDAYLVANAATGIWAGHSNTIASFTRRGWEFVIFSIGRFIYVESVDTYYHKNAGGLWVTGFGNQVTTPNSVPLSAAINFGRRAIVENQTTTAPPGSPAVGTAYIIGPSATGAWAGLDGKIAICEVAGTFVIYTPSNGWEAYDKARNQSFTFTGSAWISTAGGVLKVARLFGAGNSYGAAAGSGFYVYSGTAPTSAFTHDDDPGTISYAAIGGSGARLEITYCADILVTSSDFYVFGLVIDAASACIDWRQVSIQGGIISINLIFTVTASDSLSHLYTIRAFRPASGHQVSNANRPLLKITEFSS